MAKAPPRGTWAGAVTRRFHDQLQKEHSALVELVSGIAGRADREWYASVTLNRLMFAYFIQHRGFLDGDPSYLRNRLRRMRAGPGHDPLHSFHRHFLLRLFHEGLGRRERGPDLEKLLGRIPFLGCGLFAVHELERPERHGEAIQIPDLAFERVFDFLDQYRWHLDERPPRAGDEMSPDVLGYILEKQVNQKQMGAYYTGEDVTEYVSRNAVLPAILDRARSRCPAAFENPRGPTVWDLLEADPDRYIFPAARHGAGEPLPDEIAAGMEPLTLHRVVKGDGPVRTLELRRRWNRPAPGSHALPAETWREVVARRARHDDVRARLAAGAVRDIDDLVTLNLDIRRFALDVIQTCERPDLLRAMWHAIDGISILDPTCGSGAFLLAALSILEPVHEACLDRMRRFADEADHAGEKGRPEVLSEFREVLARAGAHPNRRYFILTSIILNNLYGVDLMEGAIETCKLRLFLKLAAQVEPDATRANLGIEPFPDVDFNLRAGNSLVGYATPGEVEQAVTSRLDFDQAKLAARVADLQRAAGAFRARQLEGSCPVPGKEKQALGDRLEDLNDELDRHLAGEYGIQPTKKGLHASWRESHRPFHWFVELPAIQRRDGFDVVIGNPPYLEYSKVKGYTVRNYTTARCANLYAFTVERSLKLCSRGGRLGMIVPISIACSGALEPLRRTLRNAQRSLWLSHFSNRPGQLFTGAQNRLTIFIASGVERAPRTFSTRYHRWDARNGERTSLFSLLRYQHIADDASMFHGLLPKIGQETAASVLRKLAAGKTLGALTSRRGRHGLYWVRVPGYFCIFLVEPPMARPEGGGPPRIRGEVNELRFEERSTRDLVHAVLNSSTYYQFFCTCTDTRHINPSDVTDFPLDLGAFSAEDAAALRRLSARLTRAFASNMTERRKSGLSIRSVDAAPCKPVIDEIDVCLARHHRFTEEELDFIVSYDLKHRLGPDAAGDAERE